MNKMSIPYLTAFSLICIAAATPLHAGDIKIGGAGHVNYIVSPQNDYLGADEKGSWQNAALAIYFSNRVSDNITIWAQIFATEEEPFHIDWAFVDYKTNNINLRAGQMRFPTGLYNEVRDVKLLHLSTIEPIMYQEVYHVIHEFYRGLSVGRSFSGSTYHIDMELFLGDPGSELESEAEGEGDEMERNLIGISARVATPVEGLNMQVSANRVTEVSEEDEEEFTSDHINLSAEYVAHNLDIKTEYLNVNDEEDEDDDVISYYAQAGYTFMNTLTPFVRYDYILTGHDDNSDVTRYQKDLTIGIGYKFNDSVSLKIENHFMTGIAMPYATGEVDAEGEKNWNLFAAGINFVF